MNKNILFSTLLFLGFNGSAQQLPIYSQYYFNDYIINPAATGLGDASMIQVGFRNQWTGFTGAPKTFTLGGYARLLKQHMGLGGMIFRDDAGGALSQTGALINYAYHVQMNRRNMLSFGLSAALNQYTFDGTQINVAQNDAALHNVAKQVAPDLNLGVMYKFDNKLRIGLSANQLLEAPLAGLNTYNSLSIAKNRLARHYHASLSYLADLNRKSRLEPYLLLRSTFINPTQFEVGARLIQNKSFMAGLAYRHNDAAVLMVGAYLKDFYFSYNYDLTISDIQRFSSGSHELMAGYRFRSAAPKRGNTPMWR